MSEQALLNALFLGVPVAHHYLFGAKKQALRQSLGLESSDYKEDARAGLLGGLALGVLAFSITLIAGAIGKDDTSSVTALVDKTPLEQLTAVLLVQGVTEEIFFRAWLLKLVGNPLQALLFGAMHSGFNSLVEVLAATLSGLLLGKLFEARGNALAPIIAHVSYNAAAVLIVKLL